MTRTDHKTFSLAPILPPPRPGLLVYPNWGLHWGLGICADPLSRLRFSAHVREHLATSDPQFYAVSAVRVRKIISICRDRAHRK
jgi:hypothetical protein